MGEPLRTDKLSITVPSDIANEVRSRAGHGHVSSYVTDALLRKLELDRLGDLIADLDEVHQPVSDDELAAARAEWPDA